MELTERLKIDGISKGLCRQWQRKLVPGLSTEQLVKLYIKGIDFCISEDYPTLAFLREHFRGKSEEFGVFIDDEIPTAVNMPDMVLNGACNAMVEYDGYSVSRIFIRHTSEAAVVVSDHAVVTIDVFDSAKLHLAIVGDAGRVMVNVFGKNATIEYVDHETAVRAQTTHYVKEYY